MNLKSVFVFLLLTPFWSVGQRVQWADTLHKFSSQKNAKQYAAKQILGTPDAMPQGGSNPCAWSPRKKTGYAKIKVGFKQAYQAKQVVIAENYNPGCVYRIYAFDEKGEKQLIKEFGDQNEQLEKNILHVPIEENIRINAIQLYLVSSRRNGWPEIDAIGLSNTREKFTPKIHFAENNNTGFEKAENLGKGINSEYDELSPVIDADDQRLYFVRKKHPENNGGKNGGDDIWYTKKKSSNAWEPPSNIGTPLNTTKSNAVCAILPGNQKIAVRDNYSDIPNKRQSIAIAQKRPAGWSKPVPQKIEDYYNLNPKASFFLCNDGETLVMAIERNDSYGGLDLYVSFKKGENQWGAPQNLGPSVNTAADEITPFLAADGQTLYFSSKGHRGYGNNDVFFARKKDDWRTWTKPLNIGKPINSEAWDASLTLPASGQYGYFTSYRNTMNMADIYRVRIPQNIRPQPVMMVDARVQIPEEEKNTEAAQMIGENFTIKGDIPIHRDAPDKAAYKMIISKEEKRQGLIGHNEDFIATVDPIDVSKLDSFKQVKRNIDLKPIEVGQTITLNNIFFEFNKAELKPASFSELNQVYTFLTDHPQMKIQIAGHTDSVGEKTYNQKLSKERARSVRSYLVKKGIAGDRIKTKGYGESKPVATNQTESGRKRNRRVTFTILKK